MIQLLDKYDENFFIKKENQIIKNAFLNNPFIKCIVCYDNDEVIGYLLFEYIYDRIEIDDFYVDTNKRNNGIGSSMLEYLISYSIKKKVKNITLEVKSNNYVALQIYKKYGFISVAKRDKYYGNIDGVLMEKEMI